MKRKRPAWRAAAAGVLTALALTLTWVETLLPLPVAVPGVKLGLGNAATLAALYLLGGPMALAVTLARATLAGLLFGSLSGLLYSLAGAGVSFGAMALLKKTGKCSVTAVSCAGALAHNLAQLSVAALVVESLAPFGYLPALALSGLIAGLLTGTAAAAALRSLRSVPADDRKARRNARK